MKPVIGLFCCILLFACSKSVDPEYFSLMARPLKHTSNSSAHQTKIGIDIVNIPEYLDSPYLKVFVSENQSKTLENEQWAGPLDNNIQHVIQTNLTTMIPHSSVELAPWDSDFYPDYHLHIEITQFNIDVTGNSRLRVIYTIEHNKETAHQYQTEFYEKINPVTPANIVASMNRHVNRLSERIARNFTKMAKIK